MHLRLRTFDIIFFPRWIELGGYVTLCAGRGKWFIKLCNLNCAEQFGDPTHIGVDQKKSRFMRLLMRCMPQSRGLDLLVAGGRPHKQTSCWAKTPQPKPPKGGSPCRVWKKPPSSWARICWVQIGPRPWPLSIPRKVPAWFLKSKNRVEWLQVYADQHIFISAIFTTSTRLRRFLKHVIRI